jgi:hypothetical protein
MRSPALVIPPRIPHVQLALIQHPQRELCAQLMSLYMLEQSRRIIRINLHQIALILALVGFRVPL